MCFYTFSDKERVISKEEWDKERFGNICGKSDAFAELKSGLLRLCRISRRCSYQQWEALRRFGVKIDEVDLLTARSP